MFLTVTESVIKKSLPPTAAAASYHSLRDFASLGTLLPLLADQVHATKSLLTSYRPDIQEHVHVYGLQSPTPFSQQPATGFYPDLDQLISHPHILLI